MKEGRSNIFNIKSPSLDPKNRDFSGLNKFIAENAPHTPDPHDDAGLRKTAPKQRKRNEDYAYGSKKEDAQKLEAIIAKLDERIEKAKAAGEKELMMGHFSTGTSNNRPNVTKEIEAMRTANGSGNYYVAWRDKKNNRGGREKIHDGES